MWSDHKESSRLHNSKGMLKIVHTEFEHIGFELYMGVESYNDLQPPELLKYVH